MMSRRFTLASVLAFLALMAAPAAVPAAAPVAVPPAAEFLHQAAAAGAFVRQAGVLVQDHARGVDVRVYADQSIADYVRAIGNLKAAGGAEGFRQIDAGLNAEQAQLLSDLAAADPKTFDKAYMKAQVKVQEQAVALIQAYARRGDDPVIRQAAEAAAAILQGTLVQAKVTDAHLQ